MVPTCVIAAGTRVRRARRIAETIGSCAGYLSLTVRVSCSDLARSAQFWSGVLGSTAAAPASGRYQSLVPEDGAGIC